MFCIPFVAKLSLPPGEDEGTDAREEVFASKCDVLAHEARLFRRIDAVAFAGSVRAP